MVSTPLLWPGSCVHTCPTHTDVHTLRTSDTAPTSTPYPVFYRVGWGVGPARTGPGTPRSQTDGVCTVPEPRLPVLDRPLCGNFSLVFGPGPCDLWGSRWTDPDTSPDITSFHSPTGNRVEDTRRVGVRPGDPPPTLPTL